MTQRLRQNNSGARLRLTEDEFLIATETPLSVGGVLRQVRMRIARSGYAERSVHEYGVAASSFWHYSTSLPPVRLEELATALVAAQAALKGVRISDEPNGAYRHIQFWNGDKLAELRMEYVCGIATHDVPAFGAAWDLIVRQFPQ
jgi:hypothetical protein